MSDTSTPTKTETLHFDALLTPYRSLNRRGFIIVMSVMCTLSVLAGGIFLLQGAWPIPGFMGLDVLLVYVAFKLNYRQARAYETVQLSQETLTISKVDAKGRARIWQFQPYWVKVDMDDPPEHESALSIVSHGKRLVFGGFLAPEERLSLAKSLRAALAKARLPHHLDKTPPPISNS